MATSAGNDNADKPFVPPWGYAPNTDPAVNVGTLPGAPPRFYPGTGANPNYKPEGFDFQLQFERMQKMFADQLAAMQQQFASKQAQMERLREEERKKREEEASFRARRGKRPGQGAGAGLSLLGSQFQTILGGGQGKTLLGL